MSSCPDLFRASTSSAFEGKKDVDGRDKHGHDGGKQTTIREKTTMGLLDGKVALITGAGGGLGEAYAKLFAREGAAVVVNDLGGPRDGSGADVSMAQKVVNAIKAEGGRAVANGADISTLAGGQSVFDDAIKNFGRADILVNNAGILLDQTFAKATEAAWDKVLKVHLKGTFCVTQPVFRWMRENGGGVIVNTSSTSGLIGNFGQSNYGAAKGGIWGLSNVLAIEGRKYNIRVWTLAPGALTRMTADLPRYIENPGAALGPDGIAPAVLYMVSDLSGDQTGKVLGVSGPRGVREMRMMEKPGWKPPHQGWKAQDVVEHAKEIFFSEEEIKMGARRF
jgi:NAD(P)-dependent dehydrogenase (short-subunit alcohol dehydrogenase family)